MGCYLARMVRKSEAGKVDRIIVAELRALADEHGVTPSQYEMREALKLARQLRDEGMGPAEAAMQAGTLVFRLYGSTAPWAG